MKTAALPLPTVKGKRIPNRIVNCLKFQLCPKGRLLKHADLALVCAVDPNLREWVIRRALELLNPLRALGGVQWR